ncbi:SCO2524 family protein [Actinomadura sp. WMMA1423]|uniref:SCO2524 family protein n=1 Tax=Actinomadura sp. WMMA1423 TaxID=2591108 RepID=UPI001146C136|nr:SCO2524 family protein [Actinomadura sp. WMMA1423]
MRIQPREELLNLWRSVVKVSLDGDKWQWGGRYERNSISDAEQLLCIIYPATVLPYFRLDQPDETADDILEVLRPLGDELDIPQRLIELLIEHIEYYTDSDGPSFAGGSYFKGATDGADPTPEQMQVDVVDSFSMAVSLMLSTLSLVRGVGNTVMNPEVERRLRHLERIANVRLTAAMVGLLRSFVINVFTPDSNEGQALLGTVNRTNRSNRQVAEELRSSLQEIRASLGDVTFGFRQQRATELIENRNRLFEIGWTWGIAEDAPEVEIAPSVTNQRSGVAESAPFLYFTVNALDGIADLFSGRTTVLGLLNEEQQRLAGALKLRWELTQRYWGTIATFGDSRRWPLEDLPWRTTDDRESDHFSLLIISLVLQDQEVRGTSTMELPRLAEILMKLGERGRVTSRATRDDAAVRYHTPGTEIQLGGSGGDGPDLIWRLNDFSPLLLKDVLRLAKLSRDADLREDLVQAADEIWDHIFRRRIQHSINAGLWDDAANVFEALKKHNDRPSWYYTERIVECIVMAINLIRDPLPRSSSIHAYARGILSETDNLFDLELLEANVVDRGALRAQLEEARLNLNHAHEIASLRPATAVGIAMEILRMLEKVGVARQNAAEGTG